MTVSERIEALVAQADALRPLHDDDPLKLPLAGLIDHINDLRAVQATPGYIEAVDPSPSVVFGLVERARGRPGRKPRAVIEGSDAV